MAGLALAGCAELDATAGVEPPPAEAGPIPIWRRVPRPPRWQSLAERQAEIDQLVASRDASLRDDRDLRAIDPGRALPPPRARCRAGSRPRRRPARRPAFSRRWGSPRRKGDAAPGGRRRCPGHGCPAACSWARSWRAGERRPLADFQRKVLDDLGGHGQAGRTAASGSSAAGRRRNASGVVDELARLGMPAGRSRGPGRWRGTPRNRRFGRKLAGWALDSPPLRLGPRL